MERSPVLQLGGHAEISDAKLNLRRGLRGGEFGNGIVYCILTQFFKNSAPARQSVVTSRAYSIKLSGSHTQFEVYMYALSYFN